jgi:hypothetical protein
LQVLDCAVLLTSCQLLHSKHCATCNFDLPLKMPSILPRIPCSPSSGLGGGGLAAALRPRNGATGAGALAASAVLAGRDQLFVEVEGRCFGVTGGA